MTWKQFFFLVGNLKEHQRVCHDSVDDKVNAPVCSSGPERCVVQQTDSPPNSRWQCLPYYQSPVTSLEITPTHDGRSVVSVVIALPSFGQVAALIAEHGRGWRTKSQIICGKRVVNYDVLNCGSLGSRQLSERRRSRQPRSPMLRK